MARKDGDLVPTVTKSVPVTSQFFSPFSRLRDEVDRLFDEFPARLPPMQLGRLRLPFGSPAIDMTESEKSYNISIEVPGVDPEDVDVSVSEGMLKISGEKKEEREETDRDYHYSERTYGRFERVIALPQDADPEKISAKVKKGVLRVTLPKDAKAEGRKHRVRIEAE